MGNNRKRGTKYIETTEGTPQGSILSPVLANIYMYYVLVLWFEKKIQKNFQGESYIVVYADDFVCCFQYRNEAELFMNKLLPENWCRFSFFFFGQIGAGSLFSFLKMEDRLEIKMYH